MRTAFQLGLVLYQLKIGMDGLLLGLLWKRRDYLTRPAFAAMIGFGLLRSLVLFPVFYLGDANLYARLYWPTHVIGLGLTAWLVGEIWGREKLAWAICAGGILLAITANSLFGVTQALPMTDRLFGLAVGVASLLAIAYGRDRSMALGLLLATALPALFENIGVLREGYVMRFIPTLSYFAAQIVWLRYFWRDKEDIQRDERIQKRLENIRIESHFAA